MKWVILLYPQAMFGSKDGLEVAPESWEEAIRVAGRGGYFYGLQSVIRPADGLRLGRAISKAVEQFGVKVDDQVRPDVDRITAFALEGRGIRVEKRPARAF